MNISKSFIALFVFPVVAAFSFCQTPATSSGDSAAKAATASAPMTVTGKGARPLEQALDGVRVKYGWLVSYEDPQYLVAKDLKDSVAVPNSKIPAGTFFSADIPAADTAGNPPEEKSLQALVDAYNHSNNPGRFELRKGEDSAMTVVGVGESDDKGGVSSQKPLLDTVITIPEAERSIGATVELLCKAVADETHMPVTVGVTPRAVVDFTNVKAGGTKVPARTILAQAIAASTHPIYWRLLYDPDAKGFMLNIHGLHAARPASTQTNGKPASGNTHP